MNGSRSIAMTGCAERTARRGLWRSRWAAVGAAVAVTLGGGGLAVVSAATSAPSSIVTIDPVRILDTRTDVGLPGPFVSAVSQKLLVTGATVPAGATGVLLNVTGVTPTANGFLSIRPGDATGKPSTSSLNINAGDIVPNAVQVGLPTSGANAGQIDITFDAYGVAGPRTEVLIDVVGYMVAGGTGTGPAGPAGATGPAGPQGPVGPAGQSVVEFASATDEVDFLTSVSPVNDEIVASEQLTLTLEAPADGKVSLVANATAKSGGSVNSRLVCQITEDPSSTLGVGSPIDVNEVLGIASPASGGSQPSLGTNRVFPVVAGTNTFDLMCAGTGTAPITIHYRSMTATFTQTG